MDATHRAILAYRSGSRYGDTTEYFLADLRIVSRDGFRFYETGVEHTFGRRIHYGQVIKTFGGMPVMDGTRRYSPGGVVTIEKRPIFGRPPVKQICTSHVEHQNLSVRMGQRRSTLLTNGFSKKIENHSAAVSSYVAHYDFCRVHETIRTSQVFAIGVASRVGRFLNSSTRR